MEQAAKLGNQLGQGLRDLQDTMEVVVDVRGRGLLQGLELGTPERGSVDDLVASVTRQSLQRGLHINIVQIPGMGGVFRIAPPLTISEEELAQGMDILRESIAAVAG